MRALVTRFWFWAILTLPALAMARQGLTSAEPHALHNLLEPSGETSARLLIIALCITPLSRLFPTWQGSRWLIRNRRAIGVAAFCYGCLHLALYLVTSGSLATILDQIGTTFIWLGWLAFIVLIPLALTSTSAAVRRLGRNWKRLHRLAYLAAMLTFLHWVAIYGSGILLNVLLNFSPLLLLAATRIWLANKNRA